MTHPFAAQSCHFGAQTFAPRSSRSPLDDIVSVMATSVTGPTTVTIAVPPGPCAPR